jgi:hypothetical protein
MDDPFRDLDLRGIEAAERKARTAYPVLWRVAELVMFVRDPLGWVRSWRERRALGYDGRPK